MMINWFNNKIKMQKAKDISEVIKNWVQIVAVIGGGIWAYYTFGQKEAPSLEPRADVNSSMSWQDASSDSTCRALFKVIFHNTGNSSFDISKVVLKGWLFDEIHDNGNAATFLDIDSIQNSGNNFFNKTYKAKEFPNSYSGINPFIIHYPPDASYNHTFEWEVKDMKEKWICFKIEFFIDGEINRPKWVTSSWDNVCLFRNSQ